MTRLIHLAACCLLISFAVSQEPQFARADEDSSHDTITWTFDDKPSGQVGTVLRTAGPATPEFPDFTPENRAIKLDGRGSRIVIPQGPDDDSLQFGMDAPITVSAWIAPRKGGSASHRYIIGKGRTGSKGFRQDNQNWALRITPKGNEYQLSFLFASANGDDKVHWHRWTTDQTFPAGDGWHHVATSYQFGTPESVRSWIDGQPCQGRWDMAGPTTAAPIVDDDAVWIGSAMRGSHGNSFVGSIDSVSVRRSLADDIEMASAYRRDDSIARVSRLAKPQMPKITQIPAGRVVHQIIEGLPIQDAWPDQEDLDSIKPSQAPNSVWTSDAFLLPGLPKRYDEWGIRSDWKSPALLRIAADVQLPTGQHRFMIRARSLGRLWIDGKLVAETKLQNQKAPSGEEPITPIATPPMPGVRVKGYRQQEVITDHEVAAESETKTCRVVFELIVGGKQNRTETGEVTVAIESADGKSFGVLVPINADRQSLPLTAPYANQFVAQTKQQLESLNVETRRSLARSQDLFWQNRHQLAKRWSTENPAPDVPKSDRQDAHPIDAFLEHRIAAAKASLANSASTTEATNSFDQSVLPILREHCFRCHGKAEKGGLRLDSHAASIAGGDSGWAAIVPGKPDESELVLRLQTDDPSTKMPLAGKPLSDHETEILIDWIRDGARWPDPAVDPNTLQATKTIDDAAFLRRVCLDTIGIPPSESRAAEFLNDDSPNKRQRLVDEMLDDDRVADHLVADWLDLLAENPTLLNTSLNSTGPFRFFLHDAFVDRKPIDRMATELILMRGDRHTGGSSGFGVAGENDSPLAAKAHILASGLLGIDLQCARCHDSPFHSTTQEDLFSLAAMLNRKPLSVPATSRVPDEFFEKQQRDSLIEVTLAPGRNVDPNWSLARYTGIEDDTTLDPYVHTKSDSRDRLAALITAPANQRFPAVIVNRTWTRLMGAGLVDSLNDWEHHAPNNPELLDWLSHQFVENGYDIRHLMRLIMTSDVYARSAVDPSDHQSESTLFFASPFTRRLTAEQVVDTLFSTTGRTMDCEELTFVHDGRRPLSNRLTLGVPQRAWMMATLNNERDRPSLSLPKARTIVDVLQAFGWNGSRQKPIHGRESDANVLQPGVLANGVLSTSLSRATIGSPLADVAINESSPDSMVDALFLRFLTRYPSDQERQYFAAQLKDGFDERVIPERERTQPSVATPLPLVHWFNHLRPRANEIQQELERRVRLGPPSDPRLESQWRSTFEDVIWSLINHDEYVWMP